MQSHQEFLFKNELFIKGLEGHMQMEDQLTLMWIAKEYYSLKQVLSTPILLMQGIELTARLRNIIHNIDEFDLQKRNC